MVVVWCGGVVVRCGGVVMVWKWCGGDGVVIMVV